MAFAKITVLGHVGQDPKITKLPSGSLVANLSIACGEKYKDKTTGEMKEKPRWFDVAIFQNGENGLVTGVVGKWVKKGTMLFIEGTPEIESYEKDGQQRKAFKIRVGHMGTSLQLCGGKPANGNGEAAPQKSQASTDAPDDEIPF